MSDNLPSAAERAILAAYNAVEGDIWAVREPTAAKGMRRYSRARRREMAAAINEITPARPEAGQPSKETT